MFNELEKLIPKEEPDLQIGCFSLWVTKIIHEDKMPDYIVMRTPMLLNAPQVVAFSPNSDIKIFELKKLLQDLKEMYATIGKDFIAESPFEESEFGLTIASDNLGHIKVKTLYRAWGHAGYGHLEFEDAIDQTYLPNIISKIEVILERCRKNS